MQVLAEFDSDNSRLREFGRSCAPTSGPRYLQPASLVHEFSGLEFREPGGCAAKAQTELINPEKSQVATIRSEGGGEPNRPSAMRRFQADSISSVRPWGQHGIATIQTTAIDQTTGTINLTTILAQPGGRRTHLCPPLRPVLGLPPRTISMRPIS